MDKYPIKIATAQSRTTPVVGENGQEIRRLMTEARAAGASLVHFPESAISGCAKAQIKSWKSFNWHSLREELHAVAALAREIGLWVVLGCAHHLTPPNRPHNSLYVVSDRGELITRYDKRFCSHTEISHWYTPGREPLVFEVAGWRFGCALCIEIHFPELFKHYADLGVNCVLFSAYADDPMFAIQAQGYAASHSYWVSLSVPTQMSHGLSSRLIAPSGEVQAHVAPTASAIAVGELDEHCPRWEIALHRAKPWRARARDGAIFRQAYVNDPRSDDRSRF